MQKHAHSRISSHARPHAEKDTHTESHGQMGAASPCAFSPHVFAASKAKGCVCRSQQEAAAARMQEAESEVARAAGAARDADERAAAAAALAEQLR